VLEVILYLGIIFKDIKDIVLSQLKPIQINRRVIRVVLLNTPPWSISTEQTLYQRTIVPLTHIQHIVGQSLTHLHSQTVSHVHQTTELH
jgi:hypothetical protein